MKSLWNEAEAAALAGDLEQRVYSSRLLGGVPELVLHGGGNTSVKITQPNLYGEDETLLYVKGSGHDLATIDADGFAPLRLAPVLRLAELEALSDEEMANQLRVNLTRADAPDPSVEAILHALIPHKFVDHTHSDAILAVTNTPGGVDHIREIYGDSVVIVPYAMPGFELARTCAQILPGAMTDQTRGVVLMQHGLFTFGDTARESYGRMIDLVTLAEDYLASQKAWTISLPDMPMPAAELRNEIAALRKAMSDTAGRPMILQLHSDPLSLFFAGHDDVERLSQSGPATSDHIIRTKQFPMLGRDVEAFAAAYREYFAAHEGRARTPLTMLDPAPRVILEAAWGMISAGPTVKAARIAGDIYQQTMTTILRADALESWQALSSEHVFDMEYWDLQQAKLRREGQPPVMAGEIGLVTGAASGIGKACVDSLLARGAAVIGLDINPDIETMYADNDAFLGITCDVTDEEHIKAALEAGVRQFGGLDILVLNAGIFPKSSPIADIPTGIWQKTLDINLTANLVLMREAHPLLKLAPRRGKVGIVGSKNVPAPGPGAVAYSATKAALNQLARVAALEWGADGIRINSVHPNMVFDTALWTPEILAARAKHYGISIEEYKTNNVLRTAVTSHHVAEMIAEMCGPLFECTTASQVAIDGGNERVI